MTRQSPARATASHRPWCNSFEASDPDEARSLLSTVLSEGTTRVTGDPGGFRMTHVARGAGPLSTATLTQTPGVEHRGRPPGRLLVGRVLSGRLERETCGESLRARAGDVFLLAPPDRSFTVRWADVAIQLVHLDADVLSAVAPDRRTFFTGYRPVSPAAARHCAGLLAYLSDGLLCDKDTAASALLVDHAARLLGATLLTTFPNTVDGGVDQETSAPAALRRALAFVEGHAHEPIGLADIASAAHVTPRTLQLTFRQRLATTPTEYLRRVRLDRAHQELLVADPSAGVTVTAVAKAWGFFHEGRFAVRYRDVYGRSPRETLHTRG